MGTADVSSLLLGQLVHSEAEDGVSNAESKRHDVGQPARRSMPEPAGPRAPSSPSCNGPGSISSTELNGSELNDPDATLLRLSAQSMEPLGPKQVRWSAVRSSHLGSLPLSPNQTTATRTRATSVHLDFVVFLSCRHHSAPSLPPGEVSL
jgi:hypothetical protein